MTQDEFDKKKAQLRKSVTDFTARERARLNLERDFLQTVLDNSLGKTVTRTRDAAIQKALLDLSQHTTVG